MAIYVDEIKEYAMSSVKPAARRYGTKWCHMVTDGDKEELHAFARLIGLSKASFQEHATLWHYDLVPSKRLRAIQNGAIQTTAMEVARMEVKREGLSTGARPGVVVSTALEQAITKSTTDAEGNTRGTTIGELASNIIDMLKGEAGFVFPFYVASESTQAERAVSKMVTRANGNQVSTAEELAPGEVFVFGSNLAGFHGGGAARVAHEHYGAVWGQGVGLYGQSYALPTKNGALKTLPMDAIENYAKQFLNFAGDRPDLTFKLTRVGCGLAGLSDEQMSPLFENAPSNVIKPVAWGGNGYDW